MIQIEKIEITEFRGIRRLTLDLKKASFGIAGPNGTGKSGVVDAVEFGLTGNITCLGGAGSAEISVKSHAPHVDSGKTPEKSIVKLTVFARGLGKSITIERSVKTPSAPKVTPDNAKTRELLAELATHPEFALSRREIVKYILTPAGDRAKDVQTLLRLDQIEKVRSSLKRIANDTKREQGQAQTDYGRAVQDLVRHLGIKEAKKADLLAAVNERRAFLKLELLSDLPDGTSLKEGVVADEVNKPEKQRLSKATALADLKAYTDNAAILTSDAVVGAGAKASSALEKILADPEILKGFRQKVLVEQGLSLIEDEVCPLCDLPWAIEELKAHLAAKIAKAGAAAKLLSEYAEAGVLLIDACENYSSAARKIAKAAGQTDNKIDGGPLAEYANKCDADADILRRLDSDPSLIVDALAILKDLAKDIPAPANTAAQNLKTFVNDLPEPSKEDAAKEYLIVAQEKYDRCRDTKNDFDAAKAREALAAKVFDEYGTISTTVLEGIYDTVENDFTTYYRYINRDDEEKFEGKLTPSVGKLAFDVDFYGRGKFPPGAYHSEGHQDGMGLCLYLALMKHTLGANFTLAVLDDVLMSVDAGHRREVCSLLKNIFPKTQFILTTHDPVWLQFMKTENLIQRSTSFGGWTVDSGPQVWNEGDVWKQISEKLGKGDVPGAAATLRRYLEYISTILADNLHAKVEYHANGHYDLGDLWPGVIQAWKARLQEAKASAGSWKKPTDAIDAANADAKNKIADTNSETWMINKAVHYNEWANLQPAEFAAVAAAYQSLLKSMQCANENCAEFLSVTPLKGKADALRCGCGQSNYNLKSAP